MDKKSLKKIVVLLLMCVPVAGWTQSSCDKLFETGVRWQQTMTVAAQQNAIYQFEKAKVCYDADSKKSICDQQIKVCRNVIRSLKETDGESKSAVVDAEVRDAAVDSSVVQKVETVDKTVELSFSPSHLIFKPKGGEFGKVKVKSNVEDWEVKEVPDWVTVSKNNDNELIIENTENMEENERAGIIKINAHGKEFSLVVTQKKYSKVQKMINKVK